MALSEEDRADFVGAYTRVLINAWSSDEFAARLDSDPKAALTEAGIVIDDDAVVQVDRSDPPAGEQQGTLDEQVMLYEVGLERGVFRFSIPTNPQIETSELDEDDLVGIAGGTQYCCCCCTNPCCSCAP